MKVDCIPVGEGEKGRGAKVRDDGFDGLHLCGEKIDAVKRAEA